MKGVLFSLRNVFPKGRNARAPSAKGVLGKRWRIPKEDEEEISPGKSQKDFRAASHLVAIRYSDRNGNPSFRRITIRRVSPIDGDIYIDAYCHERKAPRTFKASRIVEFVDLETGEVFDDPREYIEKNITLDWSGARKRERATNRVLRNLQGEIAALVYLARSDGEFHESELYAISEYVAARADTPDLDEIVVLKHLARKFPDYESCMDGLDLVAGRAQEIAQQFADAVVGVVNADGDVGPEEEEFLEELSYVFKENGIGLEMTWRD